MHEFTRTAVTALLALALSATPGCGPKNTQLVVKHAWDPDYAAYFDDSVDFTMNPDSLSGQWMLDYQIELESRSSLSDYIFAVYVKSVNSRADVNGKQSKKLDVDIENTIKGEFTGKSLVLTVEDDQPGFDSFDEDDQRLMDKVFVAYLRLYENDDKTIGIHWHLSPLSEGLLKALKDLHQKKKEKKEEEGGTTYTIEGE